MITFSCIIVDDDLYVVNQLTDYILEFPGLTILKSYTSSIAALKDIEILDEPVDFLFIDIQMPGLSGLELARRVRHKIKNLVLISGYLEYALEGYNLSARDFLTKPISSTKFVSVIVRIMGQLAIENPFISIKLGKNRITKVDTNDIIAIEGNGNYINIYTSKEVLTPYYKLSDIERELSTYNHFKRVSKSFIISTKKVKKKIGYKLLLADDRIVNISESFRKGLILNI